METATIQSKPFSPFQIEMLEMASRVTSEVETEEIRRIFGRYFVKRAEDAPAVGRDQVSHTTSTSSLNA